MKITYRFSQDHLLLWTLLLAANNKKRNGGTDDDAGYNVHKFSEVSDIKLN